MKYIFFGTPRFAAIVLQKLLDAGMPPVAVVCNPDRPSGRRQVMTPPPVKALIEEYAHEHHKQIAILQPEMLDAAFFTHVAALAPDFFIVAAYAKILPQLILEIPRLGTIGVHPSLLPKYRGPSPIQSAILEGAHETGISLYLMDAKMDHGPTLSHIKIPLNPLAVNYYTLEGELAARGGELLAKIIPDFVDGDLEAIVQNDIDATYTKKFMTEDAHIDPHELLRAEHGDDETLAKEILRKINAFTPEPGAWTIRDAKRVKILAALMDGRKLKLTRIHREGEKMPVKDPD